MQEIDEKVLKRLGIKAPPPCPCKGGSYRLKLHDGEMSRWVLASCSCHRQLLWNSTTRLWSVYEQAGGVM
jgi:hypothetical protein